MVNVCLICFHMLLGKGAMPIYSYIFTCMLSSLIPNVHFQRIVQNVMLLKSYFFLQENWLGKNDIVPKFIKVDNKDDVVSLYFVSQDF